MSKPVVGLVVPVHETNELERHVLAAARAAVVEAAMAWWHSKSAGIGSEECLAFDAACAALAAIEKETP